MIIIRMYLFTLAKLNSTKFEKTHLKHQFISVGRETYGNGALSSEEYDVVFC